MAVSYYKTYTDATAEAQRQQRLAELLQQQAQEPIQTPMYQGIAAMPSYAAGLAKILNAYGARKASDKAIEASRQAQERVDQAGAGIAGRLMGGFTPDASQVAKTDMGYEARPLQVPEQTSLEEVTRTSQYKKSPEDALRMAMTPVGGAAMKGNPLLAQMLAKTVQTPDQTKIFGDINPSHYTPESVKLFAATAAAGRPDYSLLKAIDKEAGPTDLAKTVAERDAFAKANPQDPRIAIWNDKIKALTTPPGTIVSFGSPQIVKDPQTGKNVLWQPNPRGGQGRFIAEAEPADTSKPLPASVAEDFAQNAKHKTQINLALDLLSGKTVNVGGEAVKGDPNAVGMKGALPQAILNRRDPGGVATRAAIANISSMVIKNRSGANVTVGEEPRLMPFIPGPTDDTPTVVKKLRGLLNEINNEDNARSAIYGPEQGYKPFSIPGAPRPLSDAEEAEYQRLKAKAGK